MKFRTDVGMAGKLGYDIVVSKLPFADLAFSQQALKTYDRLKPVSWLGDQYRLQVSPNQSSPTYSGNFLMTVGLDPVVSEGRISVVLEVAEAGSADW